jgi:hypothetical protein
MSQKQCQSSTPYRLSEGIFIRAIRSLVILWCSLWKCSILCFSSNFLAMKNYAIFPSLQIYGLPWEKKVQDANKLILNMVAIKSVNYSQFMATCKLVVCFTNCHRSCTKNNQPRFTWRSPCKLVI